MLQHSKELQIFKKKKLPRSWICHYSRRRGHIKLFCFKLYGLPKQSQQKLPEPEESNVKKKGMPTCDNVGLIAHTFLKVS